MGSEKRKGWSHEEGEILLKLIDCNTIFNQNILKKLAEQFNRSASSISSKIQKLIKNKKGFDLNPEESLLKKTIDIVKMSP